MYSRINRKQFEYFQTMTQLQEDVLGSCNGIVKNQVDLIEEYSKKGIVTEEQTISVIKMINKHIEGYLNYLSLEYDLAIARMHFDHRMLTIMNDSLPKLTSRIIQSLKPFKA